MKTEGWAGRRGAGESDREREREREIERRSRFSASYGLLVPQVKLGICMCAISACIGMYNKQAAQDRQHHITRFTMSREGLSGVKSAERDALLWLEIGLAIDQ